MPIAYSYTRFSSPEQSKGHSVKRQVEARNSWLQSHPDVILDTKLRMNDEGRSAFHRKNWDSYALAAFIDRVKSGHVKSGSYLLVENLDRLSREDSSTALELFLSLVNAGIVIVQLSPGVTEFGRPVDPYKLMYAIFELSRGHSESAVKSERVGKSWAEKQRQAALKIVSRVTPGWISVTGGVGKKLRDVAASDIKLELNEHADTVRRIFKMAIEGRSAGDTALTFNKEGVPTMGRTSVRGRKVRWGRGTVAHILQSRATVGEFSPYGHNHRKPTGSPIPNYFPAVVTEEVYAQAQASIRARNRAGRGRKGRHVNLFSGLLKDARDGGTISYLHRNTASSVLVPVQVTEGKGVKYTSFPADDFDRGLLSMMRELRPAELLRGRADDASPDALAEQIRATDELIESWYAKGDDIAIVDLVARKLRELKAKKEKLTSELARVKEKLASPLEDSLADLRALTDLAETDRSDETRLRIRAGIRRVVSAVWCLFCGPHRGHRIAIVRVEFQDVPHHRDYVLIKRRFKPFFAMSYPGDATAPDIRTPDGAAEFAAFALGITGDSAAPKAPAPKKGSARKTS